MGMLLMMAFYSCGNLWSTTSELIELTLNTCCEMENSKFLHSEFVDFDFDFWTSFLKQAPDQFVGMCEQDCLQTLISYTSSVRRNWPISSHFCEKLMEGNLKYLTQVTQSKEIDINFWLWWKWNKKRSIFHYSGIYEIEIISAILTDLKLEV